MVPRKFAGICASRQRLLASESQSRRRYMAADMVVVTTPPFESHDGLFLRRSRINSPGRLAPRERS